MALKDLPEWRVSLSVCGSTLVLHDTSTVLKGSSVNSGVDMDDTGLPTNHLARLGKEVLEDLQTQLDHECRRNQAIFHTNSFIMDSIFEIFKDHNLSAKETYYLRSQCMKWHRDYQHRFLFKDLYDWCRDFGDEHPECWELCEKRLTHDPEAAAVFKTLIANTLGKATFRAIWRFVASIIDYNASFLPDDSGVYPLAHFFIRVVLSTMAPMIFRLIKREKALNEANEENEKKRRDSTFRTEVIQAYKSLSVAPLFQEVNKEIFVWIKPTAQSRSTTKAESTLASWLWENERPPPPPPSIIRTRQQSFPSLRRQGSSSLVSPSPRQSGQSDRSSNRGR
jgi:hypothetical protein